MENIYSRLAARTGGNIYIGVVGPVRTGKSTLIKRIMEQLVIPNIADTYRAERARDELPQSGSGRTIMTSEPKFVPEEAVEISPDGTAKLRIRMIDSVGYMVDGAVGAVEDGVPRMVTTPWYDREIPMTEAAELGTKKVMEDHCSIGLVVTTDGSVTDIPRTDYIAAERRAIVDMKATGKPFLVVVNTRSPGSPEADGVKAYLKSEFGVDAAVADCQALDTAGIGELLGKMLYMFPMRELRVFLPGWMNALEREHPVKKAVYDALLERADTIQSLGMAEAALESLGELEAVQEVSVSCVEPGTGTVSCVLRFPEADFSKEFCGGTHVKNTSDIAAFKILSESGVAAGVRRIEALTGDNVLAYYAQLEEQLNDAAKVVKATPANLIERLEHLMADMKALQSENESLKSKAAKDALGDVMDQVVEVKGVKLLATSVDGVDMNGLRELGDQLKEKLGSGVVVIASSNDGKVNLIAMATDDAIQKGAHAGNLIKAIAAKVGGGGGGRPNMAQAGGKNPAGILDAVAAVKDALDGMIS